MGTANEDGRRALVGVSLHSDGFTAHVERRDPCSEHKTDWLGSRARVMLAFWTWVTGAGIGRW